MRSRSTIPAPAHSKRFQWMLIGRRTSFTVFQKFFAIPFASGLVGLVAIAPLMQAIRGPEAYRVYIVGNQGDVETRSIMNAAAERLPALELDGVPVAVEKMDDKADPARAAEIAGEISRRNDALLVIGHLFSTPTRAALPKYLAGSSPIPVILATETNPDLLPANLPQGAYTPVFRLSPSDAAQAKRAAEFGLARGARTFWVVQDSSNPVYSRYLAVEFIRNVELHRGAIVLVSSTENAPSVELVKACRVDAVFFAGGYSGALTVVRQIRAIQEFARTKTPLILLSDGAADTRLLQYGAADVEGVYLTHPLSAEQYRKEGYAPYGRDAGDLAQQLISSANRDFSSVRRRQAPFTFLIRKLLRNHRVREAREVVSAKMEQMVRDEVPFRGSLNAYRFNSKGEPKTARFHIWHVENGQFREVSTP